MLHQHQKDGPKKRIDTIRYKDHLRRQSPPKGPNFLKIQHVILIQCFLAKTDAFMKYVFLLLIKLYKHFFLRQNFYI